MVPISPLCYFFRRFSMKPSSFALSSPAQLISPFPWLIHFVLLSPFFSLLGIKRGKPWYEPSVAQQRICAREGSSEGVVKSVPNFVEADSRRWQCVERAWPSCSFSALHRHLWPAPPPILGPNRLLLTSLSQCLPPYAMKVPGSSAQFSMQKR